MKQVNERYYTELLNEGFLTNITQQEYTKYLDVPYSDDVVQGYTVKVALVFRTITKILKHDDKFVRVYDIVNVPGEDNLTYPILMKSIVDNIIKEFTTLKPKDLLNKAFPVALGLTKIDELNNVFYVFEVITEDSLLEDYTQIGSKYSYVDYNNDFTFNDKLDTIVVPKLKFL